MTLRSSWRSTLETRVVIAVDAVDHVAAGVVVAEAAALSVELVAGLVVAVAAAPAARPLGQSVDQGLRR